MDPVTDCANSPKLKLLLPSIFILLASIFPFTSYLLSLSFFGLAHILFELSYLRNNLAIKLPIQFSITVILLLLILMLVKSVSLITPIEHITSFELCIVFLLLIVTLYYKTNLIVLFILLAFSSCLLLSPILLLSILIFIHNFTPWFFLIYEKSAKNAWLAFLINPLIVFSLSFFIASDINFYTLLKAKSLASHYLLEPSLNPVTIAFFSTAVYLQLVHYYCVIGVFPKIRNVPMKYKPFIFGILFILGISFLWKFEANKAFYSLLAIFHAYVELPIILMLLPPKKIAKFNLE